MTSIPHSRKRSAQPRFLNPQRIELARTRRGLTRTDLAVRLGLGPRTIGPYETIGAPVARVTALSAILGFREQPNMV